MWHTGFLKMGFKRHLDHIQDKFAMIKMYLDDYLMTINDRRSSYKFITVYN